MEFLTYAHLDTSRVKRQVAKVQQAILRDDFRSAEVKKLSPGSYFRARLDDANRLLLQFVRYNGRVVCLALEVIHQHAYDRSRFLRGARVDEGKIVEPPSADGDEPAPVLRYLHPGRPDFFLQDKVLSFDDAQQAVYCAPPPLIIVGSAGSGKTALVLEKLRQVAGRVLFVTQSAYLARAARDLYFAHGYASEEQDAEFLSFIEFLESLRVPAGRQATFADFAPWFARQRTSKMVRNAHQVYEEIRGVLTSSTSGPSSEEAYLSLGVKQSIFDVNDRAEVFALFRKYQAWLVDSGLFDPNLVAHAYADLVGPAYDFVVVDEVQDLTPVQLSLILRVLREPGKFILCGDSNQIVHPNFFAWSRVKTLLWEAPDLAEKQHLSLLSANFRNSQEVTRIANGLLKIKHSRFGSIDRESNFLVQSCASQVGAVELMGDSHGTRTELNRLSRRSTQYAVIVLRDEDKAEAQKTFQTPLIFSVQEAKGLEYPNIILFCLVSSERAAFAETCAGVTGDDLQRDELEYRRTRDKTDKSLEIYKFFINALYVALTRAVQQVFWLESDLRHPLLSLLQLQETGQTRQATAQQESSREEWEREAVRLEQQGKREQAQAIRSSILHVRPVPWTVWTAEWARTAREKVVGVAAVGGKLQQQLYSFAVWHEADPILHDLAVHAKHTGARKLLEARDAEAALQHAQVLHKALAPYQRSNFKSILGECDGYGVDMRTSLDATPLMLAALAGNLPLIDALLERGADVEVVDSHGHNALTYALLRARRDARFAAEQLGPIWERLRPPLIDIQSNGRLTRLVPHQAEYFIFSLMRATYKNRCCTLLSQNEFFRRTSGFYLDFLTTNLEHIPHSVFPQHRRRRPYLNHVMARAEVDSSYTPSRALWKRASQGHYELNPALQIRTREPGGDVTWKPINEALPRYATSEDAFLRRARIHAPFHAPVSWSR